MVDLGEWESLMSGRVGWVGEFGEWRSWMCGRVRRVTELGGWGGGVG